MDLECNKVVRITKDFKSGGMKLKKGRLVHIAYNTGCTETGYRPVTFSTVAYNRAKATEDNKIKMKEEIIAVKQEHFEIFLKDLNSCCEEIEVKEGTQEAGGINTYAEYQQNLEQVNDRHINNEDMFLNGVQWLLTVTLLGILVAMVIAFDYAYSHGKELIQATDFASGAIKYVVMAMVLVSGVFTAFYMVRKSKYRTEYQKLHKEYRYSRINAKRG